MTKEQYDSGNIYCRKLGHNLTFAYCRREFEEKPCARIKACWRGLLPLDDWLKDHFKQEEIDYIDAIPAPKLSTLIELIEKAKKGKF
jgi:hypothetical protein